MPIPRLESATLTVWLGVGSRHENEKVSGISHFLEHMAFKGSKKRPTPGEIAETIDAIGGEFNAATAREWTNFHIKARTDHIETAFDVLGDMLLNPLLKNEEIERERGVILEEIAMKEDTPTEKIADLFTQLIFKGNPLGRDIAGAKRTVKGIKRDDFEKFRTLYYGASNIVVTVAGGVKESVVRALSQKYFGRLPKKRLRAPKKFKSTQKNFQVHLTNKKSEQAHFVLGFPGYPRDHKDKYCLSILSVILGSGMSSRLFIEIRDKRGLAYAVNSMLARYIDTGLFAVYAGVVIKRVDEAIKVVLDQIYGLADGRYPISTTEFKKAKEFMKGRMALALEDTRYVNDFFGQKALFLPKIYTPEEVFKKIDKVNIEDVLRVAKEIFDRGKCNLAIIGPYKSQAKFEKLLA